MRKMEKKTGYKFTYPEYESDGKKFAVTVEVRPYQNTENADADYNKKEVVDLKKDRSFPKTESMYRMIRSSKKILSRQFQKTRYRQTRRIQY